MTSQCFFSAPKIETEQMHIWKRKIFTLGRLIAGWENSIGRLLRTFDPTKNFFSVEIIFCVDICVPSSTLEKALFFSFFQKILAKIAKLIRYISIYRYNSWYIAIYRDISWFDMFWYVKFAIYHDILRNDISKLSKNFNNFRYIS